MRANRAGRKAGFQYARVKSPSCQPSGQGCEKVRTERETFIVKLSQIDLSHSHTNWNL